MTPERVTDENNTMIMDNPERVTDEIHTTERVTATPLEGDRLQQNNDECNDKDRDIEALRCKIKDMKMNMNQPERISSHYAMDDDND